MASHDEWLKRARSSLGLAKSSNDESVYYEDLCFQAQQAVEKALKALLIYHGVEPERTHNLYRLLEELERFVQIDDEIKSVLKLYNFAVQTRYPGEYLKVEREEYEKSVSIAENCLKWVEEKINKNSDK
jgi:HEPN domain-containing protein